MMIANTRIQLKLDHYLFQRDAELLSTTIDQATNMGRYYIRPV
jgi:hypothetical protein